jgi:inhibitor of cysteine peptidase
MAIISGLLTLGFTACSTDNAAPDTGVQAVAATNTPLPQLGSDSSAAQASSITVAGREAVLDSVEIVILESFPVQVKATVRGNLPDSCVSIEQVNQEQADNTFSITLITTRLTNVMCIEQQQPFEEVVSLEVFGLPAGVYTVTASSANQVDHNFELTVDNVLSEETTESSTPGGIISGMVWHDSCHLLEGGAPSLDGAPSAGCAPDENNNYQADGIFNNGEERIAGVQVLLKSGECPGLELIATTLTNANGEYAFAPAPTGIHCVSIDPQTEPNRAILLPGGWSYPAPQVGYATLMIEADKAETADFGWAYQFDSPPDQGEGVACLDKAAYIADITIPDDMVLAPGQPFVKTWRIRNDGGCLWGPSYSLIFVEGDQLAGPAAVLIQEIVPPGGEVDLSAPMVAPLEAGRYRGDWLLQNGAGETFGSRGDFTFYVQIVVDESASASPSPASSTDAGSTGGSITGLVWKDFCGLLADGSPTAGCISNGTGGYRADGFFGNGEERISGVQVTLNVGECPGSQEALAALSTDANGAYQFSNLQPGLYCVSIDPHVEPNRAILLPGDFTYPAPHIGSVAITLLADETQTADFGWNYHLAGR